MHKVNWGNWDSKLGTVPDSQLAKEIGVTRQAVCDRRNKLGKLSYQQLIRKELRWTHCLLGTMPDSELAQYAGCSNRLITTIRQEQGIPKHSPVDKQLLIEKLGTASDLDVADEVGCHVNPVYNYRIERGIPAYVPAGGTRNNGRFVLTADQVVEIRQEFDPAGKVDR